MATVWSSVGISSYFQQNMLTIKATVNPLGPAIENNDVDLVKSLLENGSEKVTSYFYRAGDHLSFVCLAAQLGRSEIVDLLISSKHQLPADERDECWGKALTLAVRGGHVEIMHSLCVALDGVDHRAEHGNTALMSAVAGGNLLLVNALLFYGADINTINADGETPLTMAVLQQDMEMVHALLAHEAWTGTAGVRLDLEAVGHGGLKAMELAVILRTAREMAAGASVDERQAQAKEVALGIVHALRLSGAAEVEASVVEILIAAAGRRTMAAEAATSLLLDELKESLMPMPALPRLANAPAMEEQIRAENLGRFRRMRAESLGQLERQFGHL